jgi:peptidoglycan glycosyltransferase
VVAVDPRDGSVLAFWSAPSFDPNPLSAHDRSASQVKAFLEAAPGKPLLPKMYRETFFPGSTFKAVTGAIGVDSGGVTPTAPSYPVETGFDVDFTDRPLSNFGGNACGGPLFDILRVSCNSAFAHMGVDTLGAQKMVEGAERFGFNQKPPIDLPAAAASRFPTEFPQNEGNGPLARASIGQGDTSSTPLQMALVAAAIANDGRVMAPHLLQRISDTEGRTIREPDARVWKDAISGPSAETMRQGLVGVVQGGTAGGLALAGFEVGGKTGTAQLGTDPPRSHAWIIGFAGPPGGDAEVAVAVIVEGQPGASEQTGGRVAAPIAQAVMAKILENR